MSSNRTNSALGEGPRIETVHIRGYRSIRNATLRAGNLSALVGEPGTGKSNLLYAVRAALDSSAAMPTSHDFSRDGRDVMNITVEMSDGSSASLTGTPPSISRTVEGGIPPLLYLPARLRAGRVVASPSDAPQIIRRVSAMIGRGLPNEAAESAHQPGMTEAAHALVAGIETWLDSGPRGVVVLIEEPELFLSPQVQRYLYRLLRDLASHGNQVFYSTHSPSFLNVARLHELVLTEHTPDAGTYLVQPDPLPADEEFRAYSEFDSTRSELFLARAAILVEGQTERLALPFAFRALGFDPDREGISIIECGGKSNIVLVAKVAAAIGIPFLAVHDRDAAASEKPNDAEQQLNRMIGEIAGKNRVELAPDFEGVTGLRGRRHKPARAWKSFASLGAADLPAEIQRIVERSLEIARLAI